MDLGPLTLSTKQNSTPSIIAASIPDLGEFAFAKYCVITRTGWSLWSFCQPSNDFDSNSKLIVAYAPIYFPLESLNVPIQYGWSFNESVKIYDEIVKIYNFFKMKIIILKTGTIDQRIENILEFINK